MNGFARRLVLTQRQTTTRKWPTHIADAKQILCNFVLIGRNSEISYTFENVCRQTYETISLQNAYFRNVYHRCLR